MNANYRFFSPSGMLPGLARGAAGFQFRREAIDDRRVFGFAGHVLVLLGIGLMVVQFAVGELARLVAPFYIAVTISEISGEE